MKLGKIINKKGISASNPELGQLQLITGLPDYVRDDAKFPNNAKSVSKTIIWCKFSSELGGGI